MREIIYKLAKTFAKSTQIQNESTTVTDDDKNGFL